MAWGTTWWRMAASMATQVSDNLLNHWNKCLDGIFLAISDYDDARAMECINSDLVNTLGNLLNRCTGKSINPDQIYPSLDDGVLNTLLSSEDKLAFRELYELGGLRHILGKYFLSVLSLKMNFQRRLMCTIETLPSTRCWSQSCHGSTWQMPFFKNMNHGPCRRKKQSA